MRARPTARDLLMAARRALREDLADSLPPERRYEALMIANAMAIAARQVDAGAAAAAELEQAGLRALMAAAPGGASAGASLEELCRTFAVAVRGGAFDPATPGHDAAGRHLWETTLRAVRESNPRYLESLPPPPAKAKP